MVAQIQKRLVGVEAVAHVGIYPIYCACTGKLWSVHPGVSSPICDTSTVKLCEVGLYTHFGLFGYVSCWFSGASVCKFKMKKWKHFYHHYIPAIRSFRCVF